MINDYDIICAVMVNQAILISIGFFAIIIINRGVLFYS